MAKKNSGNPTPKPTKATQPKAQKDGLRDLEVPEAKADEVKGGPRQTIGVRGGGSGRSG